MTQSLPEAHINHLQTLEKNWDRISEVKKMYKCGNCGKVVETGEGGVRCPFCGYKILFKTRSGEVRTVLAR